MNESRLTDLLERAATQTPATPPPLDAIRTGATRRRRRRTAWVAAGTALAVATAIGGTTALTGGPSTIQPPVAAPKPTPGRTVVFGGVTVTVPGGWATDSLKCGTPDRDTVIIDPEPLVQLCGFPRPANVESVQLARTPFAFRADKTMKIGDEVVQRQTTRCVTRNSPASTVCTGAVWIPNRKVWVEAVSSTDALTVDRLLQTIHFVIDSAGVPGYRSEAIGKSATKYMAELQRLGLKWRLVVKSDSRVAEGQVLAVAPAVGTMVDLGATVTVTVSG